MNTISDREQSRIELTLREHGISFEIDHADLISIDLRIDGDWHHDHAACRSVMETLGYTQVSERTISDTEDDWYESVHTFFKGDRETVEGLRRLFASKES